MVLNGVNRLFCLLLAGIILTIFAACEPVDKQYGNWESSSQTETTDNANGVTENKSILSSDRVMSRYFDISLFDEENYADIYLGKNFKINAKYVGTEFKVPVKLEKMQELGWDLAEGNAYDENSLVFAYETISAVITNQTGVTVKADFYNSTYSSVKLSECYIVKFTIENNFYTNSNSYNKFNVNGITNKMAITDIIDTLGTPSHFYKVSDTSYYLDYFISKKDRRNGITVYINPVDDLITAIEFSYYK